MKIEVKVIPNASETKIVDKGELFLKIKIAAPPEKNKANKELVKFLKEEGLSAKLISGATSRRKIVEVSEKEWEKFLKK